MLPPTEPVAGQDLSTLRPGIRMLPACLSGTVCCPTLILLPPTTLAPSRLAWMLPVTHVSNGSHHRFVTRRTISCSPPSRPVTRTVAVTSWPAGGGPDSLWIETVSLPSRFLLPESGELSVALMRSLMPTIDPEVVVPSNEKLRSISPLPAPASTVTAAKYTILSPQAKSWPSRDSSTPFGLIVRLP